MSKTYVKKIQKKSGSHLGLLQAGFDELKVTFKVINNRIQVKYWRLDCHTCSFSGIFVFTVWLLRAFETQIPDPEIWVVRGEVWGQSSIPWPKFFWYSLILEIWVGWIKFSRDYELFLSWGCLTGLHLAFFFALGVGAACSVCCLPCKGILKII